MSKSLTFNFGKIDDDIEIISSLTFNKIKKFEKLDTLCIVKQVNVFAEDFRETDFGPWTYYLYNVDDCLLLSKDLMKKKMLKK